jgi:nitrogen regulatory protein P-II 1
MVWWVCASPRTKRIVVSTSHYTTSKVTTQRFDSKDEEALMKLLKCVVRPNALEKVKEALSALGVMGMTVSEVKGYGRQKGHKEVYRGAEYNIDFIPKLEIEIVVGEEIAERAIDAVKEAANTGNIGDGKIFVVPVDEVIRIRTGEMGDSAI